MQSEPQIHLPEMIVAGENVRDAEVLHDDHAGEIDEGNVRLIVILLAQVPGAAKLLG
jgi:hypothetical protein